MDVLNYLAQGFAIAWLPSNLGYCLAGLLTGFASVMLPGIGPAAAIALLLPMVARLNANSALILLAAVYYGARHGAAMLSLPAGGREPLGVSADAGGQPGPSYSRPRETAVASWCAAILAMLTLVGAAYPLAAIFARLGPSMQFSLMVFALVGALVLTSGSLSKALGMSLLGMLLGQLDHDLRMRAIAVLGPWPLPGNGLNFYALAIGLFVISGLAARMVQAPPPRVQPLVRATAEPSMRAQIRAWPALLRGSVLGFLFGALPGRGARLGAAAARVVEVALERAKRSAPGQAPLNEEVACAAAANAGTQTAFMPLLLLGIAPNATLALVLGALMLKSVYVGPLLAHGEPPLLWSLAASMAIGATLLALLNGLLQTWSAWLLARPYCDVAPLLAILSVVGLYQIGHSATEVYLGVFYGLVGWLLLRLGCKPAALMYGFVLGPMLEDTARRALAASHGNWRVFSTQPLTAALLVCAFALALLALVPACRRWRERIFRDTD